MSRVKHSEMDWKAMRYFKRQEFLCKCCGKEDMDWDFVNTLERLRETLGKRITVTSGWRCLKYNATLPNAARTSLHLKGLAADISVTDSAMRFQVIDYGMALGFNRFGIGKTFIHLDHGTAETGHPINVIWTYYD